MMNRRNFLKTSALTGSALTLGMYYTSQGKVPVLDKNPALLISEPTPLIRIEASGKISIFVHKPDMGQGTFQSMPALIAEEMEVDMNKIEIILADLEAKYGDQLVGGSQSVQTQWIPLRQLGASMREMLLQAAAKKWETKAENCYAQSGKVFHKTTEENIDYQDLVEIANTLPIPQNPKLKDPKDFKILGKPQPRPDVPLKVNGTAQFGLDVKLDGMLYAGVERAPVYKAKAKSFDKDAALAVKGVKAVMEVERNVFQNSYYGVAVIAENYYAAMQGRKALKVNWNTEGLKLETTANIYEKYRQLADEEGNVDKNIGNFEEAFSQSAKKVTADYETPFLAHAAMEPQNALAHVTEDSCELWLPYQGAGWLVADVANAIGIPAENVKVHMTFMGGGFGRRALNDYAIEAARLSQAMKAPVKVVWTREDDISQSSFRPGTMSRLKGALDENGKLIAFQHKVIAPSIGYQLQYIPLGKDQAHTHGEMEVASSSEYNIPNFKTNFVLAETDIPICWWRSVYSSNNAFGHECFIDELAHAAGKDPIEFRKSMLKNPRHIKVLEKLVEKSNWYKSLPVGWGMGIAMAETFGSIAGHVVLVSHSKAGIKVEKVTSVIDCGMTVNPLNIEAQTQGNVVMALTAATKDANTFENSVCQEKNFDRYRMLRIDETPEIEVYIMENQEKPGGAGEPGLPPLAPALANAIFNATGKRIRKLPIDLSKV